MKYKQKMYDQYILTNNKCWSTLGARVTSPPPRGVGAPRPGERGPPPIYVYIFLHTYIYIYIYTLYFVINVAP